MALSKNLMAIAGDSLKANITTLGPLVLPISEQLLFFMNLIGRKVRSCRPAAQHFMFSCCARIVAALLTSVTPVADNLVVTRPPRSSARDP